MSHHNPFLALDQRIVGDCYACSTVMDNLITLCDDFGSRFGGTEGERQAAEFFRATMVEYGLKDVHLEPFGYVGWVRGQATFEIVSPVQKTIPCISLPHSPAADLEGVIVDLGDGAPEDFEERAAEIEGKIVMTTSVTSPRGSKRWVHRGEKFGRSLLAGAVGFIFVNHYPGYGPATGGIGNAGEALIPGISVAKEDGAYLQRLARRYGEVHVRITSTDRCAPMTSWNVVGDLPGGDKTDEIVMVGSHYDGHDISQGAEDPASGAVSVLEAARLLAEHAGTLPRTVRFVLWGVEEIGLLGSRAYVAAHADEMDQIRFYLNMDSAGARDNTRDIVLNEWPALQPLLEGWSREMALPFAVAQKAAAFSDHFPFFLAGVPTGGMQSAVESLAGRGYGHTRYDTVDKVEIAGLRHASTLAARLLLRMASAEEWPVARRAEADVLALLETPENREAREIRARVDALYQTIRGA
ncbi:MAG: M20/M25/M40 family metallo-hydrolase [Anaerolineae bacterium]|nr:M20/M25/M40 family metallo-hydrolase [Anaerolineae bacterium]